MSLNPYVYLQSNAARFTTSGGKVDTWSNIGSAGSAGNASQTLTNRPDYVAADPYYNNLPTISLDGTQFLDTSALTITQPLTIYVVGHSLALASVQPFVGNASGTEIDFYTDTADKVSIYGGSPVQSTTVGITPRLMCGVLNGASSAVYVDDATTAKATGAGGSSVPTAFRIAGNLPGSRLSGKIAEVIIYKAAHTTAQRNAVFNFLYKKFAMATYTPMKETVEPYIWLASDPSRFQTSGGNITNWTNQGSYASGANVSQVTAGNRPTYIASDLAYGNRPTALFDGKSLFSAAFTNITQPCTVYVVGQFEAQGTQVMVDTTANPEMAMYAVNGTGNMYSAPTALASGYDVTPPCIMCGVFRNGSASDYFVNDPVTAKATGSIGTGGMASLNLGSSPTSASLKGKIAEVIIYTGAHSSAERTRVMNYLQSKFAIGQGYDPRYEATPTWSYYRANTSEYSPTSGNIAQWNDVSGNARHMTQATGGNKPLITANVANGYPGLAFDGTNDFLQTTSYTLGQPYTVYVVPKFNSLNVLNGIFDNFDNTGSGVLYNNSNSWRIGAATEYIGSYVTSGFHVVCVSFEHPAPGSMYVDLPANQSAYGYLNSDSITAGHVFGRVRSATYYFGGVLCEVIMFKGTHNLAQRTRVMNYFNAKFLDNTFSGLTTRLLAVSTPVAIWVADASTITAVSGDVSVLADIGPNTYNLVQPTAGDRFTYTAGDVAYNNRAVMTSDGASWMDVASWGSVTQPFTIYVVGDGLNTSTFDSFIDTSSGGRSWLRLQAGTGNLSQYAGTSVEIAATYSPAVFTAVYNGASSNSGVSSVVGATGDPGTNGLGPPIIGNGRGYSIPMAAGGRIAAVLVYNGAHTAIQRAEICNALANYYRIPVLAA